MKCYAEYTDTFCGEANYAWVRRTSFDCDGMTDRQCIIRARRELGLTNMEGRSYTIGDMYEFRPYASATVLFITWE